jgi:hypothetical protein
MFHGHTRAEKDARDTSGKAVSTNGVGIKPRGQS